MIFVPTMTTNGQTNALPLAHFVEDITATTIVHVLKDTIVHMNLKMSMCQAQCYDSASNMKKAATEIES